MNGYCGTPPTTFATSRAPLKEAVWPELESDAVYSTYGMPNWVLGTATQTILSIHDTGGLLTFSAHGTTSQKGEHRKVASKSFFVGLLVQGKASLGWNIAGISDLPCRKTYKNLQACIKVDDKSGTMDNRWTPITISAMQPILGCVGKLAGSHQQSQELCLMKSNQHTPQGHL